MSREPPGHVLQTTALVNEAYLRLIDWKKAYKGQRHLRLGSDCVRAGDGPEAL
jgi:hypothetical protein